MSRDYERAKNFSRRAVIVGGVQAGLISLLMGRLFYLQILERNHYAMMAEDNRINLRLLIPPRGHILDRNGVELALNRRNFRCILLPEDMGSARISFEALQKILPLSDTELTRIARELDRRRASMPVLVRDNLTWDDVALIEVNTADLPGVRIEIGQSRHYPFATEAAHVLGYVAAVNQEERSGEDPLLGLPDFRIGKKGIEKYYDEVMRGVAGASQIEVDAYGRVMRELKREEGKPGQSLQLTLDIELQKKAMELLGNQSGSIVVLNVETGEVLVLASAPAFDPNVFNEGLSFDDWRELSTNPKAPLANKAISGLYAPGSTFKVVTALAGLESGIINADHHVYCSGYTELGSSRFHCWKRPGHGTLDLVGGIRESCDVYFYDVAQKIGIDRIAAMAHRLGLGAETGIDLPGEKEGLIPSRAWKLRRFRQNWQKGETLIAGIGQGYILATPLQLAVLTARLVNEGKNIKPFVAEMPNAAPVAESPLGISSRHMEIIRQAMIEVTNSNKGTAYGARITQEGYGMGGKTGTSQVRRISLGEREHGVIKNEDRPWHERDHALFIGFAPYDKPRYAVAVVIEHGGGGSAVAAPMARDILLAAQKRDELKSQPQPEAEAVG